MLWHSGRSPVIALIMKDTQHQKTVNRVIYYQQEVAAVAESLPRHDAKSELEHARLLLSVFTLLELPVTSIALREVWRLASLDRLAKTPRNFQLLGVHNRRLFCGLLLQPLKPGKQ